MGLDTLRKLRLVNKAFYQSASRVLFRSVIADIDPDLSPKLSTIKNLEDLIKDDFAQFVREIRFNVIYKDGQDDDDDEENRPEDGQEDNQGDAEEEEEEEEPQQPSLTLTPEKTEYIRFLLAQFPNLRAVSIGTTQGPTNEDEIRQKIVVKGIFAQILYAVSSLQDQNVVRLAMAVECLDQLFALLTLDPRWARFGAFMQQLQHITLDNLTVQVTNHPLILERAVLDASPQLLSLEIRDSGVVRSFQRTAGARQTLQLRALNLSYMQLSSRDLLDLLMRSKDTLKYVAFEYVILTQGSWLYVLIQMRKNLELLKLYFMGDSMDAIDNSTDGLYYEDIQVPPAQLKHALGDLQRQINANRTAAGLEPYTTEIFDHLDLNPLHTILRRNEWQQWDSRTWEFVEDGNA